MNKSFIGKKLLSLMLSVLMCLSLIPSVAFATIAEGENYLQIKGFAGFENIKFDSFANAYETIKPKMEELCGLGQEDATAEAFDAMFTDRDGNGNAAITYTVHGTLTYDETSYSHLLTMGRKSSHYSNERHLINFKFVGANNNRTDTLAVNSNITLPYEWWGEKTVTAISFEGLTITGSAPHGIYTYQSFFEGIDFKIDNCTLKGIKVYNCSNVGGSYTITNSTFDGTGTAEKAYAIHLQGNDTAPLSINISDNIISGYDRGINIDQATAVAVITGNSISVKENGRSCIQFTQLAKATASGNTLNLNDGNAFTFYSKLAAGSVINITGNIITGNGYLAYDDTKNSINLTYSGNSVASTVDTTKGIYGATTKDLSAAVNEVINNKSNFVAKIGEAEFESLQAAFDAANTGNTVTLLTDIALTEQVNITKALNGLTLDGNGKTITCATTTDPSKSGGSALYFGDPSKNLWCTGIKIKNLTMTGTARYAIFLSGGTTTEFTNVNISGNYYIAVNLYGTHGATMTDCNISNSNLGIDKYSSAIWTNVASQNPLILNNSKVNVIAINSYTTANKLEPKIFVNNGSEVGEVHSFDDGSVSGNKKLCVSTESTGSYTIKEYDSENTEWVNIRVAKIGDTYYETLQAAIDAAGRRQTVTLVSDTKENVTIAKPLTLDLNGYTLNGGTVKGKPALTVTARGVTVEDSGKDQTGTIMREDTAENSGVSSHYVIDVQGAGLLTFKGGNVKNDSGNSKGKGASLVRIGDDGVAKYPQLNIMGGTFTQNNFVVIKVDRGYLSSLNGGTINSAYSYAIENWFVATVNGGTVNGDVASWTYSDGANSTLEITGGTIYGNVTSVNYGNAENKKATVKITGGTVNGELDTRSYDPKTGELTAIDDAKKAAIEVSGGTFTNDPTAYLVEDSSITVENGKYSVAKAYLAKVGDTQYYTMDEAFKAQTASGGKDIVLLRDYETAGTFRSGSIKRTVDLNGHTWTYTGTGINDAAFEINYSDATLTVMNGTVISNSMIGLIPSAMSGTIMYDNSALIFENVKMTANGHSGIETNGNNTNDTVTLKNSTLNVPNGFGIYFPSSGTLNIENSKITAKTMGVQVCSGSLNISGDSVINVTGDPVEKTENDGAIQDGAAVSVVNRPGYKGLGNVTITGGTFTSENGKAIKAYTWKDMTESDFDLNVIAVSGGTFSSAVPANYCAEGYVATKNKDNTYSVVMGAYVAKVGGVKYESLEAAYVAAADNATITLLANCNSGRINLEDKNITLVLNGYTVTSTAAYGVLFCVKNGKTITIDGTAAGSKVVGTIMITGDTYGHIVINGGTYESALYCPIYVNGAVSNDGSTLKITNAVIMALNGNSDQDNGVAVYLAGYATSTFTNCTISAPVTGIEIRAGKLDLINCDVTGGSGEIMTSANGNGTTVTNVAVAVSQHTTKKAIGLNITGGTYTGTAAVYQTNVQGTGSDGVKVNISSGTFNGLVKAETTNVMAISGGTFSSAVPADYCAAGYAPKANTDGTYGVEPKVTTEKRNLSVDINGAGKVEYSINGSDSGIWSNSITKVPYEIGTQFTVKAVPRAGSTFLYWVNSEGRVISDAPTYSFYLGDNLTIKAVFCYSEDSAYVTFRDMGNTILMAISADSDGYVNVPTNLIAYAGYTFIGWYDADGNKYEEENGRIKVNGNAAITIYAKYKADTETLYTVTVDGIEKGKYTYGSYVTVTAEDIEGKEFAGWYINGTLVSYDKAYSFYVTGNVALEASYSDTVVVKEPVITLLVSERKETGNGSQYIILTAAWSADSSYTFVDAGIIVATNNSKDLTLENVDEVTVLKKATRLTTVEGTYTHTLTLSSDAAKNNAIYVRAYFTFIKDGKVVTIYTAVQVSKAI